MTVRTDLTRYGFVINEEKSLWEPVQVITCLGTIFDTYQGLISVTERRVSKLKSSIDLLRKDNCKILNRVRTGPGNPGKSWNFIIAFSRTGKSWKSNAGPGKSWKSVKLNKVIKFSLKQMSKVFLVFL